jgi:hypothetical protein
MFEKAYESERHTRLVLEKTIAKIIVNLVSLQGDEFAKVSTSRLLIHYGKRKRSRLVDNLRISSAALREKWISGKLIGGWHKYLKIERYIRAKIRRKE